MRAVVVTGGDPPVALAEAPEPVAAPDEAVVAVTAFSLNRGELRQVSRRPTGWRPGQDVAGVVAVPAADGSGPSRGTRVVALSRDGGGWAERVAVRTDRLAAVPDGIADTVAATLPVAGITALRLVRWAGAVLGEDVLVTAPGGGVGQLLVPLLAAAGARVTVWTRHDAAVPTGASHQEPVPRRLGEGDVSEPAFAVVLDGVGGTVLESALSRLRPGGSVLWYGSSSGEPARFQIYDFFGRENAVVRPFLYYRSAGHDGDDLGLLLRLVAHHVMTPHVGLTAPWEELAAAMTALAERRFPGKAVLTLPAPAHLADMP
jgi:NADPH:quinone reductase-like Zn-dependent oxidoreductase